MGTRIIRSIIMTVSLLLLATYCFLNFNKLETTLTDWANISSGDSATRIQLSLSGESVFQKRLKASEIFDTAGKRQIHFIHLPKGLFARTQAELETAKLEIYHEEVTLSSTNDESALLAVTKDKRIYLLKEGELKYMMTVIWNEQRRSGTIVQCATPLLCDSLSITSKYWSPVQGPFLESELNPEYRGLPKGRWLMGPKTVLTIQSRKQQTVWMQIKLLGEFEDQELSFRGTATRVQKFDTDPEPVNAGGKLLYPAIYMLALDLKPGSNHLEISFSEWSKPVTPNDNPVGAYVTVISLKGQ